GLANDIAWAVLIQSDGRIVAAGSSNNINKYDFALARYNPDGTLDTSFNGSGKLTTAIGTADDSALTVAIQSDGRIVAAGSSDDNFALARYNLDGMLDTSFNGTGTVTTLIGFANDIARAVAIQSDGRIVAAGSSNNGTKDDFALVRYNPDGTLD